MKKVLLCTIGLLITIPSFAQMASDANNNRQGIRYLAKGESIGALINFNNYDYDFGVLETFTKNTYDFVFVNKGDEPLLIDYVYANCDCTTAEWPEEPVLPGQEEKVRITYDTKNRLGKFHKVITIGTNAPEGTYRLYIKGSVVKQQEHAAEQPIKPIDLSVVDELEH